MNNNENLFTMTKVDFDQVLEYNQVLDAITSDKFNTENIFVIPTQNGLDLGLNVKHKDKFGNVCEECRLILLDHNQTPFIFIGHNDLYEPHFTEENCFAPVQRLVCDSRETNWYKHKIDRVFPLSVIQKDSVNEPVAEQSIFEFDLENHGSEYFANGEQMNYLSQHGLAKILKYIFTNPERVADRVYEGVEKGTLHPLKVIHINLNELGYDKRNQSQLGE